MVKINILQIVRQRILFLKIKKKYFSQLQLVISNVRTILEISNIIESSGRANIILPSGTKFIIDDALFSSRSKKNLLSFKDIYCNGYYIETINKDDTEYLYITSINSGKKCILEKLPA